MDPSTSDWPTSIICDVHGVQMTKFVQDLHAKLQENIWKKVDKHYARIADKTMKDVNFQPEDWVEWNLEKYNFLTKPSPT